MKKKECKFAITCLLIAIIVSASAPTFATNGNTDSPSAWAIEPVMDAINYGFVPIELQTQYQNRISRAEFTKVALYFLAVQYNYYDDDNPDISSFLQRFANSSRGAEVLAVTIDDCQKILPLGLLDAVDISLDSELSYYNWDYIIHNIEPFSDMTGYSSTNLNYYVNAAYVLGIVNGRGDGTFGPADPITRQEAATMLSRVYNIYKAESSESSDLSALSIFFDSSEIGDWAQSCVSQMVAYDIMTGVGDGWFSPSSYYTREQCYTTFLRLFTNMPTSRLCKNVERFSTLDEDISSIETGFWVSSYRCYETDMLLVVLANYGGLPHGGSFDRLYIFYVDGGVRAIDAPSGVDLTSIYPLENGTGMTFIAGNELYYLDFASGSLINK